VSDGTDHRGDAQGARSSERVPSALWAMAELRLLLTLRRLRGRGGAADLVARTVLIVAAVPVGLAAAALGTGPAAWRAVRYGSLTSFSAGLLFVGVWCSWTAIGLTLADRETFDLRRMLAYPVSPALTFVYEQVAALLADPFSLFWLLLLAGAFAGAALAWPGPWLLLLALVHVLFAVGTVGLVSLLQEVLARILRMRRARELGVAAIYIGALLIAVWVSTGGARGVWSLLPAILKARWLAYPAALAGKAAGFLYERRILAAVPWILGQAAAAAATAWAAYRLALADARAGAEGGHVRGAAGGGGWRLPGRLGPLLEKELKYLARHPLMAVLALVVPALAGVVGWVGLPIPVPGAPELGGALPLLGFALYTLLATQALWINAFGWDRGAARIWFLAPVRAVDVLRAKNAASRGMALLLFAGCALALFATGGLPPLWAILAALALHLSAGVWFVTAGNLVSILNARPGSHALQRGASIAPLSALLGMGIVSAGSALFLPAVLLERRLDQPWALFWGWTAVGLVGAAVRRAVLPWTARLLARRREELLAAVTGDDV
jgi:ABC-2 type transport system permease protein